MEQLTTRILLRSSDAVVIIRLADGTVLDLNEAFRTATGHGRHDLVGRPGDDLLMRLGPTDTPFDTSQELGSVTDVPIGLWTRSGDLRVGRLSSLVLAVEGRRVALCTIRGLRKPTPGERRSAAREAIHRIVQAGQQGWESATMAMQAFGRCLRWDLGILWRATPDPEGLDCAAVWRAPGSSLERLEAMTRGGPFPQGMESVARSWLRGEPTWVPDAQADPGFSRARGRAGEPAHGWLGFPVLGHRGVVGAAEFLSQERRQSDPGLLIMIAEFGSLFGRLLEDVDAWRGWRPDNAAAGSSTGRGEVPAAVFGAFRDLAGAVTAATEALEQHPSVAVDVEPSALLGELTVGIGKLNRLLEDASDRRADAPPGPRSWARAVAAGAEQQPRGLPTGLTLKAVSRRTGIPAATLRTWQRRYGFMRPLRSPSGYRLYGEEEIARIEQVKYLVGQGIRIGVAMDAVLRAAESLSGDDEHARPAG
jgi:MerR HTH family regulatory protein